MNTTLHHNVVEIIFFPYYPDLSLQMCKPISGQDTINRPFEVWCVLKDSKDKEYEVHWEKGLANYFTHAVEMKSFETVIIDGLHEKSASNSNNGMSTVYLHKGKNPSVKGITSTVKNKKLVMMDDKD